MLTRVSWWRKTQKGAVVRPSIPTASVVDSAKLPSTGKQLQGSSLAGRPFSLFVGSSIHILIIQSDSAEVQHFQLQVRVIQGFQLLTTAKVKLWLLPWNF